MTERADTGNMFFSLMILWNAVPATIYYFYSGGEWLWSTFIFFAGLFSGGIFGWILLLTAFIADSFF